MKKILLVSLFILNLLPNMNERGIMTIGWNCLYAQQQANEYANDGYDCDYGYSPLPCDWDDPCITACSLCAWSGPCDEIASHYCSYLPYTENYNPHIPDNLIDNGSDDEYEGGGGSGSNDSYHIQNGRNAINKIKDGLDSGNYLVYVAEIEDPSQKKVKVIDNLSKSQLFTSIVQELGSKVIDMSNDHALLRGLSTTLTTLGVGVSGAHAAVLLMKDESLTIGERFSLASDGASILGAGFAAFACPMIAEGFAIVAIGAGLVSLVVNEVDIPLDDGRIIHIKKIEV